VSTPSPASSPSSPISAGSTRPDGPPEAERDAIAAAELALAKTERAREAFDAAAGCLIGGAA
jgi:hypothetical protein